MDVEVGGGVLVGGPAVKVGARVCGGATNVTWVGGGTVMVKVDVMAASVGPAVLDGVLVSAAKPVGSADPRIGIETMKLRALEETISRGSIGTTETIGS